MSLSPRRFANAATISAIIAVTLAALSAIYSSYVSGARGLGRSEAIFSAVLTVIYGSSSIMASILFERQSDPRNLERALWIVWALGISVVIASRGVGELASVAIVSQSVLYLKRRQSIFMIATVFGAVAAVVLAEQPMASGLVALVRFVSAIIFVVAFSLVAVREHDARAEIERLATEVRATNDQLRAYAKQIEELATTRERNRIAREIHDSLGHVLTAAHIQLEAARALTTESRASLHLDRVQGLLRQGLEEVRRSVAVLRIAGVSELPLLKAIGSLAEESRTNGLELEVRTEGRPRPLTPSAEFALFRAVQESLTNVLRHAAARKVVVLLRYDGGDDPATEDKRRVAVSVMDDGLGAEEIAQGYGLVGIRERVELLGGRMWVDTKQGSGFALHVEVPG